MTKVALSGASGNMGRILRTELQKRGVDLRSAGGRNPLVPLHEGEDVMHGDLRDPVIVDRLHQVYEGARRNKVRRIVFASSNHAFGMHSVNNKLKLDAPFRPDGFYGLSKVWGEAMARMYWDKHGIEGISVRIGTAMGKPPAEFRHLSTWFGNEDLIELMMQCINVPDVGYMAVWGVSNNKRSYWDNTGAEKLGFNPKQNSEDFAAEVLKQPNPLDPIAQQYQGGGFVTLDFTPLDARPRTS